MNGLPAPTPESGDGLLASARGRLRTLKPSRAWLRVAPEFLPFADAASPGLPLARLLRLSLFQVSVGLAAALLAGTLNRVMIVELGVAAWLVALMLALPILSAPFRALIGFRSDTHRSAIGWRRVPYIWMGSLLQFGGLAIMPFALLVLSGDTHGPLWVGHLGAALAFLLVGVGMQTTQTAGLALASDLASPESRPRVVALMYVMLLVGMLASGVLLGLLLSHFTQLRLVQVVQGCALVTMALNIAALWKQEPRQRRVLTDDEPRADFASQWRQFIALPGRTRYLVATGLGTAGFNMQDVVLEPYGAEVLGLPVGATSVLTALQALGALGAFAIAARLLQRGADAHRLAAMGGIVGIVALAAVVFAAPMGAPWLFRLGVLGIGFGGGLFAVCTLSAAMGMDTQQHAGLALGAWGAVQATCAGVAVALGGTLRDLVAHLSAQGVLGEAMAEVQAAYSVVYHLEIALLFATLVAIGPLVGRARQHSTPRFGLAELPG